MAFKFSLYRPIIQGRLAHRSSEVHVRFQPTQGRTPTLSRGWRTTRSNFVKRQTWSANVAYYEGLLFQAVSRGGARGRAINWLIKQLIITIIERLINKSKLHCASKTCCCIFAITSSTVDQFWKFSHCWIQR